MSGNLVNEKSLKEGYKEGKETGYTLSIGKIEQ